jgi:hypothetical protein
MSQVIPLKQESPSQPLRAAPAALAPVTDPVFPTTLSRTVRNLFGLDLRSLALFRITFALVFLWDLQERAQSLRAHYTGEGVFPLSLPPPPPEIAPIPQTVLPFSLHNLCDDFYYQAGLFLLTALAGVGLLLGYRTRLMTLFTWFLLLSTQARTPMLIHGGDVWMRVFLFWSLFLPLGAVWSVDALRSRKPRPPGPVVVSPATIAFILQLCFVYFFAILWKTDPAWRTEGTAVRDALRIESFTTPLGHITLQYPTLMKFATFCTVYVESFGPLLLLLPFATQRLRVLAILLFVGMHLGIGLNMELGNFVPICIATWLALLPPWFWDRMRRWAFFRWPAPTRDSVALQPLSSIETVVVLFCLAYAFFINVRTIYFKDHPIGNAPIPLFDNRTVHLGQTLGLEQGWGVFAPRPSDYYGWYIIPAQLEDGSVVDLQRNGQPVTLDKPPLISATFINSRWRRYLDNLHIDNNVAYRQLFALYLKREWDRQHPDQKVKIVWIIFMKQNPHPDGSEDVTPYELPQIVYPNGTPVPPIQLTPDQVKK